MTDSSSGVTVVVPNYNYEKTIAECLGSIYGQTRVPDQVIVVDDHSTDRSTAIASGFPCEIVRTPRNAGVAAARNFGIRHARNEYIFFVDSDVKLDDRAIENAVSMLEDDRELGSVCGIYHPEPLFTDSKVELYRSLQAHYWRRSSVGRVTPGFFSLGVVRRAVFEKIGLFNEQLKQTEEVEFGSRMAESGYGLYLSERVLGWHDDDSQLRAICRKLLNRGHLRVPLYIDRQKFMTGFETPARGLAALAAGAAAASAPLIASNRRWGWLSGSLGLTSLLFDADMYRFVLRRRGAAFTGYFAALHFVANLSIAAGVGSGVVRWIGSPTFRRLYRAHLSPPPLDDVTEGHLDAAER